MSFKKVSVSELKVNPFTAFAKDWALVSAGTPEENNTMTIGWGAMGTVWGKSAVTVYIRESRYTKRFVDAQDAFAVCFFDPSFNEKLGYLGSVSGRDEHKVAKAGLTPAVCDGALYYEEASLVFICRKLSATVLNEFLDPSIDPGIYADKDYHTMYIGEVTAVLVKE